MKITKTALDGVVIIEPQVFEDARGYFFESWNKAKMEEAGLNYDFIQDNQSKSCYGTIRGIHFQKGEFSQAKLVRVLQPCRGCPAHGSRRAPGRWPCR